MAADETAIHSTVRHLIGRVRRHGHELCTDFFSSHDLHYMTRETQLFWNNQT